MLPFRSFYGFESWLDQSAYSQEPSSSIKSVELDNGKPILSATSKSERKSMEACKSHREAERRRRQRINAHLSTLRSLLPNAVKSDKASLLAEVVRHVKELRKQADDVTRHHDGDSSGSTISGESRSDPGDSEQWAFPGESDEATVSYCDGGGERKLVKATLCCEDRPNLNRDLEEAIRSVRAKAVRAEMMTIGGRTKSVVVVQWTAGEEEVGALERALTAVVESGPRGV
ncbi:transcription factor bHLH30-like [Neltuma alba]|uniref:transcription factor bHLH30-like n=1 Tax=Neltuma alba TaxID=207710 RepID=UPI0010A2D2A9|nr:transcription factor bHLH30-like [Prosopis alba]